ncbi:MAG: MmcQ/YjbR family DNA-binding protein [Succinivibrio sp.]|nr:MmcQ/YjbR family DNA-binding protein [Succinivibrio sp.]MDY5734300.1 MmcQ/YjbR family DNA-binding protein [Succinivibrio sp.]
MEKSPQVLKTPKASFVASKLIAFGFEFDSQTSTYLYKSKASDFNFEFRILIKDGEYSTKVYDLDSECEYLLHKSHQAQGEFVGRVREYLSNLENKIIKQCALDPMFNTVQATKIIERVQEKYHVKAEFLFGEDEPTAVFRKVVKEKPKWFAFISRCNRKTVTGTGEGKIEILNLRLEASDVDTLITHEHIHRGYHMNKKYWLTIELDTTVDTDMIYALLDKSYQLL